MIIVQHREPGKSFPGFMEALSLNRDIKPFLNYHYRIGYQDFDLVMVVTRKKVMDPKFIEPGDVFTDIQGLLIIKECTETGFRILGTLFESDKSGKYTEIEMTWDEFENVVFDEDENLAYHFVHNDPALIRRVLTNFTKIQ